MKTYYGYRMESYANSVHLWCYKRTTDRRPPSRSYQGETHDTEVRWYRYEQNMMERLLGLGFTMNEIEQAYKTFA